VGLDTKNTTSIWRKSER